MTTISINLLPKKFMKRSGGFSLGKSGLYAILGACGVVLLLGTITVYQLYKMDQLEGQMEIAKARTMQLQKDIMLVDALSDIKVKITNRLEAVERLDRHRGTWVKIMEDMSRNVPEFVWLSRFAEIEEVAVTPPAGDSAAAPAVPASVRMVKPAEVEGFTFTLNALASFMIKMMRSDYFDEVDLVNTEEIEIGEQKAYNFKLSCQVHYLSDEELEQALVEEEPGSESNLN